MGDIPNRKLWVTLIGFAIATYMRARGAISDNVFESILLAGMLGYPAANVIQKYMENKKTEETK